MTSSYQQACLTRREFSVSGLRCSNCVKGLQARLLGIEGLKKAQVHIATHTAIVLWDENLTSETEIIASAKAGGFELTTTKTSTNTISSRIRFAVTAFFAINTMTYAWVVFLDSTPGAQDTSLSVFMGLLAMPCVFWGGAPFYHSALRKRSVRDWGMDFLISTGALLAYGYSWIQTFLGGEVFFDTAAMIIFFASLSQLIQEELRKRNTSALRGILSLAPDTARIADSNGRVANIASNLVGTGERMIVRAGERIPLDCKIVTGQCNLDRSMLTGESIPVFRQSGDKLEAGTINLDGYIETQVLAGVGQRRIDRIAEAVQRLASSKSGWQRMADRWAGRLVMIILGSALLSVAWGFHQHHPLDALLLRTIAVIVVACPCALSLATPMALSVAAGVSAQRGVFFRDHEAIEVASNLSKVFFDKTGTLTWGNMQVAQIIPRSEQANFEGEEHDLLRVAALVEQGSRHPIAQAICRAHHARAPKDTPGTASSEFREYPGLGASLKLGPYRYAVGRETWLREQGVTGWKTMPAHLPLLPTGVYVACDKQLLGWIGLEDTLRPEAQHTINAIRQLNIEVALLTGDTQAAGSKIASELGIDNWKAAQSPEQKAESISNAQADGSVVAFVGDGINDSIALAAADLSVTANGASDLAMEQADAHLVRGGLRELSSAILIAKRTKRVMHENLIWAAMYNLIAIPLAFSGIVSPLLASAAMGVSSIGILLNSLRIARFSPPDSRPAPA